VSHLPKAGPIGRLRRRVCSPAVAQHLPSLLAATIGVALSVAAWIGVSRWEDRLAGQEFKSVAETHHLILQNGWSEYVDKLTALRALFESSNEVSRGEFESFTQRLLRGQSAIQNFSWVPRVAKHERENFERAAQRSGVPDYRIKAVNADNELVPSPERDEYWPIYYSSLSRSTPVLGIDLLSVPNLRRQLERARDDDHLASIPSFTFRNTTGNRSGVLFSLPVYQRRDFLHSVDDRRDALTGFVHGALLLGEMVESILSSSIVPQGIDLYVYAADASPHVPPLHVHGSRLRAEPAAPLSENEAATGMHWRGEITAGHASWTLVARPMPNGRLIPRHDRAWIVLIAGLLVTALVAAYLLASARSSQRLMVANKRVSELARSDVLTGLANRRAFVEQLTAAFGRVRRGGASFAVLFFDLDHFKDVNDTLGHPIGDLLLQQVADRVRNVVRSTDVVARFGGDEFAVLQTDAQHSDAAGMLAAKINEILAAPYDIEGNTIHVSASIGIALNSEEVRDPESIMMQADLALYLAKEDGRNCYRFHSSALGQQVRERVHIADELRTALGSNQFELYYQPQIELGSGRIVGAEALLRWRHPARGLVSPDTFIPVAERTGSIVPLGRWAFGQACRQLKEWRDQGIAPGVVAVNFSAVQFKRGTDLNGDIAESLARWNVPPESMEIELTESVLMEVTQQHTSTLEDVRALGVRIAIDDFGTGYSSLNYLTRYPVNRLKIAQELVLREVTDLRSATVVRASIRLADELGIEFIAEGVETPAQASFLVSAGCRHAQGHHFSEPVPARRMTELLREGRIVPADRAMNLRNVTAAA
jgi:diguanylate cyclase (GGDEF)-like protein